MENIIFYAVIANIVITVVGVSLAFLLTRADLYGGCVKSAFTVILGIIAQVFARSLELSFAIKVPGVELSGRLADASLNMNFLVFVVGLMLFFALVALVLKHQLNMASR